MKGVLLLCICLTISCQLVNSLPEGPREEDVFALDTPCTRGQNGLTLKQLIVWLGSVTSEKNTTFITPDSGTTIFTAKSVSQADDAFLSGAPKKVTQVWMSNSLCTGSCVQKFSQRFQKVQIYISHIYPTANAEEAMKCLAKMVKNKFKVAKIDWGKLASSFTNKDCKTKVEKETNKEPFKEAQGVLDKQLQTIGNLSKQPDVAQYCL